MPPWSSEDWIGWIWFGLVWFGLVWFGLVSRFGWLVWIGLVGLVWFDWLTTMKLSHQRYSNVTRKIELFNLKK